MDADGGRDRVCRRVDDGHRARLRIDGVDLVPPGVGGDAGGIVADTQRTVGAQSDQVVRIAWLLSKGFIRGFGALSLPKAAAEKSGWLGKAAANAFPLPAVHGGE